MNNQKLVSAWNRLDRALHNTQGSDDEEKRPTTAPFITTTKEKTSSMPFIRNKLQSTRPQTAQGAGQQLKNKLVINTSLSTLPASKLVSPKDFQPAGDYFITQLSRPLSSQSAMAKNFNFGSNFRSPTSATGSTRVLTSPSSLIMHKTRPISASTAKAMAVYTPKVNIFDTESRIHHIPITELAKIYEARCIDNKNEQTTNQLKHFIDKFDKSSRRRILAFNDQCFGPRAGQVIAEIMMNNDHFTKIHIAKNFISDGGATAFAQLLQVNKNIVHLDISSNNLTYVGATEIFSALAENESLISLDISSHEGLNRNRLDARGAAALSWVLKQNKTLQFLNLAATSLDAEAVDYVCQGLQNNPSVVYLNLSSNDVGPKIANALQSCLPICEVLELDISDTKLGDQGITNLASLFWTTSAKGTELRHLNIANNQITTVGIARLFESLSKNSTVDTLILDKNPLHGKGISSLVNFLWENTTLKHLSMNECELSLLACDALSNGLDRNRGVNVLLLAKNNFKDAGSKALAHSFRAPTSLIKRIDLSDCKIRDEGAKELAETMKRNSLLESVSLKDNMIYDDGLIPIINATRINKNIKKVEFDRNPCSYKYLQELEKTAASNRMTLKRSRTSKYEKDIQNLREFELQKYVVEQEKQALNEKGLEVKQELEEVKETFHDEMENEQRKYEELESRLEMLLQQIKQLDNQKNEIDRAILISSSNHQEAMFDMGNLLSTTMRDCNNIENDIKSIKDGMKGFRINLATKKDRLQEEVNFEVRAAKLLENSLSHITKEITTMQKAVEEKRLQQEEEEKMRKENEDKTRDRSQTNKKKYGQRGSMQNEQAPGLLRKNSEKTPALMRKNSEKPPQPVSNFGKKSNPKIGKS